MCGVGAGQATMSKLNADLVNQSVEDLLAYSKGEKVTVAGAEVKGKVRKFTETVELQVSHYLQSHVLSVSMAWWCSARILSIQVIKLQWLIAGEGYGYHSVEALSQWVACAGSTIYTVMDPG